jgi:hypothetical protein
VINFPANPTTGQIFTAPNGVAWTWDGAKWTSGATGSGFLPLTGGTLTGPLTLNADPIAALNAATKEYVDTPVTSLWSNIRYRNRVINGDMSIDQRNGGTAVAIAGSSYAIDRWRVNVTAPIGGKGQAGQNLNPITNPPPVSLGWAHYLGWQTLTAYAVVASDNASINQTIEGSNFFDANWGTTKAQPVVLEFWTFSSLTGTFAGALRNGAANRSYSFTFSIPVANTWTKIRLIIPGDQTGAWSVADVGAALIVSFAIGAGPTFQTAPGVWTAGNFVSAPGAVSVLATANAYLYFTGVALMVGAAAAIEPEFRKYSDNLFDCRRYFQVGQLFSHLAGVSYAAGNTVACSSLVPVIMRAPPTCIITANNCFNLSSPTVNSDGVNLIYLSGTAPATGGVSLNANFTADSDF